MTPAQVAQVWYDINGLTSEASCNSVLTIALSEGCKYNSQIPINTR